MGPRNKQKTAWTIADMETVADLISSRWYLAENFQCDFDVAKINF